jgi:hypothetical protein
MVVNSVDRVMKTRVAFQMLNILDRAGREIVDHVDFIATLDISVAQMRSDKTRATCDKYSQTFTPYLPQSHKNGLCAFCASL